MFILGEPLSKSKDRIPWFCQRMGQPLYLLIVYIYMYIGVDKTGKHRVNGLYIDQIKLYVNLIPDLAFCLFKSEHVEWKPMVSE